MSALNSVDLIHDVFVIGGETTDSGKILHGFFIFAALDKVSRGLILKEGEAEDQAGEDNVKTGGNLLCGVLATTNGDRRWGDEEE